MSQKSKAKAAKRREQMKQQKMLEEQSIKNNAARICALTTGFGRTKRTVKVEETFKAAKMPSYKKDFRKSVHHAEDRFPKIEAKQKRVLTPEMAEREKAAQERYHEMKKLVQPLGNKMGLQYPDADFIEASKRGELRRRS